MSRVPKGVIVRFFMFLTVFALCLFWKLDPLFVSAALLSFMGSALNVLVMAVNDWRMPIAVSEKVWNKMAEDGYVRLTPTTKFKPLADIFVLKLPNRIFWYSIGDVVVAIGFICLIISLALTFLVH